MLGQCLRLWWVAVAVVLLTPHVHCRNVTNEDIRDAMMTLVHMFRTSEGKLERHELREKALGEQLKKMISSLEKKHRALEPLKGMISRLDERLSNVETILLQKEEREKNTQTKTNEALDSIQKSLSSVTASLTSHSGPVDIEENLTTNEASVGRRLDATDAKLDSVQREIENLKNALNKDALRSMCQQLSDSPLEKHLSSAEKLLNKYEVRLSELGRVQTEVVPLEDGPPPADCHKITEAMERQEKEVSKIQKLLSDAQSSWKEIPSRADFALATNHTLEAVQAARADVRENSDRTVEAMVTKLRELGDRLASTNEDIQRSLTQGNTLSERVYGDISRGYDELRNEVQSLTKNDKVVLETADNVIATKKRIEYGVHQILMEVGELVKIQGKTLNRTVNTRFDGLSAIIVENQTRLLSNLSLKIESEITQVWRQIGTMYQQLSATKTTLDKLTEQTGQYVNTSATTLGKMDSKVGAISTRITEVDDNLNYLLGRLSLVTQEFDQIKAGFLEALKKIRSNMEAVKTGLDGPEPATTPK